MAGQTLSDKVSELERLVATLTWRADSSDKRSEAIYDAHQETVKALHELSIAHEKEVTALKKDIESLAKWKDEAQEREKLHGSRLWAFLPPLLAGIIGGIIVALFTAWLQSLRSPLSR